MKKALSILLLVTIGLGLSAYRHQARKINEDLFSVLGISKEEARILMKENLFYSSLATPSMSSLRKVAVNKRAGLVREIGLHMKSYFRTPEVIEAYAAYRESLMPGRQEGMDVSARIAELREEIRRTEADKQQAPGDMKKLYEETLVLLRKQLAVLQDPSNPEFAAYTGTVPLSPEQKEEIRRKQLDFSKVYPADLQQYLKRKMLEFLELTAEIDFNAKLVQAGGRLRFENQEYEAMGPEWKKCFRAGKETIDAARLFARQWVDEIK